MATFTFERSIAASPETVFEVLADHRAYPQFTGTRRVELEREGDPPPNGLGAIRQLHIVGPPVREEVTEFEPPGRFAYKLLSGIPVRDHVGTVTLTPEGDGTRMCYEVTTFPKIPLIGHAAVAIVKVAVGQIVDGVVKTAQERSRSGA